MMWIVCEMLTDLLLSIIVQNVEYLQCIKKKYSVLKKECEMLSKDVLAIYYPHP
jgi:hypothetical protein